MGHEIRNMVIKVNRIEIETIKEKYEKDNNNLFVVELEGDKVQSWHDYISFIQSKFKFPTSCFSSMDRYLDWIRDLKWLDKEGFVLIINDYNSFIKTNPKLKEELISDFSDTILPFWEDEIKYTVVEGKPKLFIVYLVDDDF
jgi:Barstar (barnase inhibitor).